MSTESSPDKLSIIIYDHHFDKIHYALVMASAAAAIGRPVTLFFTMGACEALRVDREDNTPAWSDMPLSDEDGTGAERDAFYKRSGVANMEELFEACASLNVQFLVCEMGLRAKGLEKSALRADLTVEHSGVVTFLNDASKDGAMILI
jgi:peroxiredoxin family protein